MSVTWQNVKDMFYNCVGDNENVQAFFTETQAVSWARQAMRVAAERTNFRDFKYESIIDTTSYPDGVYPADASGLAYRVWRVEYEGEYLRPINADQIRKYDRFWQDRTSATPTWYLLDEYQTQTSGLLYFRFYEKPSVDDDTFRVYSYALPGEINDAAPTQMLNIPEWFAYAVLYGMLERAYEADTEMANAETSAFFGMMFDDAVMRLRIRSNSRLPSEWSYNPIETDASLSIWNRLPENITEP